MLSDTTAEIEPYVLIVDDDEVMREQIAAYLSIQGLLVVDARDTGEMDRALSTYPVDMIVLDLMRGGREGLSICRRIAGPRSPSIIMVSTKARETDRILGLELGADDYLAKPCVPRELLARIRAVRRRRNRHEESKRTPVDSYLFSGFRLDLKPGRLTSPNGRVVPLAPAEFSLLLALLKRPNQVQSRDRLIEQSRGDDADMFDRAIDVHVSRIRGKLSSCSGHKTLIRTVRGAGYMLDAAVLEQRPRLRSG